MKTLLRLAILLVGTISSLRAQGWTGGFKAGVGQGGFTGKSEFAWSATGFNGVFFFSVPIGERLSLEPEVVVTQKVGQSTVGLSTLTFTGDYISAADLVRLDFRQRAGFTPFVGGGPSLTFRVGCRLQLVVAGQVSDFGCEQASPLSRLDFGVAFRAGASRTFGSTIMSVEARSTLNLRSVALPDGSGFGRGFGWAVLAGASVPLRALQLRRAGLRTAMTECYATPAAALPVEAAGSLDADARGSATPPCRPRPAAAATP